MFDVLRGYLDMANGLLEATTGKVKEGAASLMQQGIEASTRGPEIVSTQVQAVAEDLLEQSRTNRELMVGLIRTEVERTVGRMGFVHEEELAAVRRHVQRLEAQINQAGDQANAVAGIAVNTATSAVPAATRKATSTAGKAASAAAGAATKVAGTAAGAAGETARTAASVAARTAGAGGGQSSAKAPAQKKPATTPTTSSSTAAKKTTPRKSAASKKSES